MTRSRLSGQRITTAALGVAMVVSTEPQRCWLTLGAAALALAAVGIGLRFGSAPTAAVVLTALTLAVSPTPPGLAVLSGVCATGYLVSCHLSAPNTTAPTGTTVLAALGFAVATAAIAIHPVDLPWLPIIAPFGLLCAFAMAVHPYLRYARQPITKKLG